jgi:porin
MKSSFVSRRVEKWRISFGFLAAILLFFAIHPSAHAASQEANNAAQGPPASTPPTRSNNQQTPQSPGAPSTTAGAPSGNGGTGFWTRNELTGNWDGLRDKLKDDGFTFTPTLTAEVFGNPSGGRRQGAITDGQVNLPVDFDLDPLSGGAVKDLTIHANAFYIYGNSLSQKYVGDFSITSNIATYDTLRLDELWIQKALWDKKITIKVGNMAVDTEYFQSASASLFINATFGAFTFIANNVPDAPVYPLASPGVRIQLLPDPRFYVLAGVYGLDNTSDLTRNNQNGIRFSLNGSSGMLIMSEAGYLLNQGQNDKGLQGSYRVGSWVDTGNFQTFPSQGDSANGSGNPQNAGTDYGIYGVVDQQIYSHGAQIISVFTRAGGAPTNTNFVDAYVDGGFNFTGFIPGRDNDVAGLGVARSHVSQDYSELQVDQGNSPSTAETAIEATYKVQLSPWWSIQPDVQYIITPSGVEGSHNALVLGLRTNVAF